ncbi:class I SAM-dependent methyltransferase [Trujillonella endophytica]|uniref:Ubiquinone/menaquinone biosynthesis C-methylase UbiE n=1 Tax=Trujillonella endophytica TaxID=673521 RepID=A0A1H8W091_9ACTN|nr:class I SAM-dependent methyltransferase [Trujillella endophytica]SEP21069.1 Ubiquinone/menaquinone biosynthesis C-methylase UbiE [Trujillella endophytica]
MTTWTQDPRSWPPAADRARHHWMVEHRLRQELLASNAAERERVTREVYNELFREVPWHDANVADAGTTEAYEEHWLRLYGPLTRPTDVLLDIGCGRGSLVRHFARVVAEAVGLDASDAMVAIAEQSQPGNVRFVVGNLLNPPLPPCSVDFVVSRQLMEHLHPDDVPGHLRAVHEILRPGGRFLIETPSRITGPWDISRGFTDVASGFHLREYTNSEMGAMLRSAGFRRVRGPAVPARVLALLGRRIRRRAYVPVQVKGVLERALRMAPPNLRPRLAGPLLVRDVTLVAERC